MNTCNIEHESADLTEMFVCLTPIAKAHAQTRSAITSGEISPNLANIRINGLNTLTKIILSYWSLDLINSLITPICIKKVRFIMEATSATEINLILKPSAVTYNGGEFKPKTKYHIEEEELLMWSQTSLNAPLNQEAFKRYLFLFNKLFPDVDVPV